MEHRSCGQDHAPFTPCPTRDVWWGVFDATTTPPRRIAAGSSLRCAESLFALYLHVAPDVDPSAVYIEPCEVTA